MNEIQEKVLDIWEADGVEYFDYDEVGFNKFTEMVIKPEYQALLDDNNYCEQLIND